MKNTAGARNSSPGPNNSTIVRPEPDLEQRRVQPSGIGQPGGLWTVEANRPVVLDTIELFGADRCMFASNFPVDSLCASFADIFKGFESIVADFSAEDRRKLFHDNALRIYRMTAGLSLRA